MEVELQQIFWAVTAILVGGFLKGVTGAGTPVVGVPILTALFSIQFAVAVFSVLNLVSNLWHAYAYRGYRHSRSFVFRFAMAGAAGAVVGSVFLAWLPTEILLASLSLIVFAYVLLRIMRSDWQLSRDLGDRFVLLAGLSGGLMQGAGGISAPVSVTFLNALRLSRKEFIATISVFFCAMSITQIPSLVALGVLTQDRFLFSCLAIPPLFLAIWCGEAASKYLSKEWFDRAIILLLIVIAIRLLWTAAN